LDAWYGGERHDELHLPMDTLVGLGNKLSAAHFRQMLSEADEELHGSPPLFVFDNHDNIRSWERFGDGVHNADIAKIVAALLLTSRSAALIYQGEEIGQVTSTPTKLQDVKDPIGISGWPKEKGRDGERTPMQWDDSNAQAGFSSNGHTWLPVPASYKTVNVAQESQDPNSMLSWHRRLIELRRVKPALAHGHLVMLDKDNPNVLIYARVAPDGAAVLVCLNMSASVQTVAPQLKATRVHAAWQSLVSNQAAESPSAAGPQVTLAPYGTWIGSN
jgi:alpha-glucosidase